jgi:hypothetical protein
LREEIGTTGVVVADEESNIPLQPGNGGLDLKRLTPIGCPALAVALIASGCGREMIVPPSPARNRDVADVGARPGERYFLLVFGSQSRPKRPCLTHTWATAVRVVEGESGPEIAEEYTISWLPATLRIHPLSVKPVPGVNLGLHETLAYVLGNRQRVLQWGPYECRPWVLERVRRQAEFLESGRIGYQCTDGIGESRRLGTGCNCVHALTDIDPDAGRRCYPLHRYGHTGSENAVLGLAGSGAFVRPEQTHEWVSALLGLADYPIECRPLPSDGGSRRLLDWLLGYKRKQ